jgi:DNA-binding NarL/FixJ family response regulator
MHDIPGNMQETETKPKVREVMPSAMQVVILNLKAKGKTLQDIEGELGMKRSTLARELYAACCILQAANSTHAVAIGITEGWLTAR